ncbi:MAG: LysR family transcriptional regulator [Phenylobacterium sp.]|uniref:LysR family transcriptional regulator n=1 Tax=Phenylobacterium sp. TaxID=1871053 RepID=UPI00391CA3A8
MFDWNDLRAFLAVARHGSAAAAASELQVNQTTVVRRLEALEAALGLQLVERSQTGSRLTWAGTRLLAQAERVSVEVDGVMRQAQALTRELSGVLRVTSVDLVADNLVIPALTEFRTLYPGVAVELIAGRELLDIAGGEADVAIRSATTLEDSDLVSRKLLDLPFGVVCSRAYAAEHGVPAGPQDLASHCLVGGTGALAQMPILAWMREQAPLAEVACRSNHLGNLISAVRSGLGVGAAPLIDLYDEPDLILAFVPDLPRQPELWLITRSDLRSAPIVRAFLDFIIPYTTRLARSRALARGPEILT